MSQIVEMLRPIVPSFVKLPIKKIIRSKFLYKIFDPNWHRRAVGGWWDEIGKLQFDFLVANGLRKEHYLLDVGCGSLRGGVHFIRYLEPGHYYGVEKSAERLEAGRKVELKRYGLEDKQPVLVLMENFDFQSLNRMFDYAIAQSVFTHLQLNSIIRCIMGIEKVLTPDGHFYATINENPRGKFNLDPITHRHLNGIIGTTYFDQNPYHYDFSTFQWICEGTKLRAEYIGEWKHPRDQRIIVFTKE